MQKVIIFIVLGLIIGLGITYQYFKKNAPDSTNSLKELAQNINRADEKIETKKPDIEVVYSGIKRPHGIGFHQGIIYVSSEIDKALYKVIDGKAEKFVDLNFTHDMIFEEDGSIITPVFNENRVVKISKSGEVETLFSNLSGPNGIVKDKNGDFYVSNYFSGKILALKSDGRRFDISQGDHQGSAGLTYLKDKAGLDDLWVASYIDGIFAKHDLQDDKVGSQLRVFLFSYPDIIHPESLYLNKDKRLFATATKDGKGVIIEVFNQGVPYKIILETDLPDPLVGYFTEEGFVYLVSPNDLKGRILRSKIF